jgi:hypothetical protein
MTRYPPPPPTRFGAVTVQRQPQTLQTGVAPPPTRFAPPGVRPERAAQAKSLPAAAPQRSVQPMKRGRAPLLPGNVADFTVTPTVTPKIATANQKRRYVEISNGGIGISVTVDNNSPDIWTVGLLQAVTSYKGLVTYDNSGTPKSYKFTFNSVPIKDASRGNSKFYDGAASTSIKPNCTGIVTLTDQPWASPDLVDITYGNLVSVRRKQTFIVWLWAYRQGQNECLELWSRQWGFDTTYDAATDTFTGGPSTPTLPAPSLSTILAQNTTANAPVNLVKTIV